MAAVASLPFSQRLQAAAQPAWDQAVGHRFVQELGANTLEDAAYRRYLIQDYLFIDTLARVIALIISQAPDMPPKSRLAGFLAAVTSEENDYFLRAFAALGVEETDWQHAEANAVTGGLQDLMLDAARDSYLAGLTVLTAAEWIYLSWATDQAAAKPERFYLREWITIHCDPAFVGFVTWLRDELDRRAAALGDEEQSRLIDLFRRMADLEVGFFEAAYQG